jgi:hypothetical protein
MLRILPAGKSAWQTVHKVPGDSLYRVAFDDSGRLMATWEKEPFFHLFVPQTGQHLTFDKPPPPSPEFKYGFSIDDLYFTKDGAGAIVYMHGFVGGRTWSTVAYHYAFDRPTTPTLLYKQPGYTLHDTRRLAVYALPKNPQDACEHNFCQPLGEIVGWEISGTQATKRTLLSGEGHGNLSRVQPVWGTDDERVAVMVTEHPHKHHVLRWQLGQPADFRPLPPGPVYSSEDMRLMSDASVVETWITDERGLELRRHAPNGAVTVRSLAPLPRRTPHDHPLFGINASIERKNGDFIVFWGEYLVVVPPVGPARRLDLRTFFGAGSELTGRVIYVPAPEGFWLTRNVGRAEDFVFLTFTDLERRALTLP